MNGRVRLLDGRVFEVHHHPSGAVTLSVERVVRHDGYTSTERERIDLTPRERADLAMLLFAPDPGDTRSDDKRETTHA